MRSETAVSSSRWPTGLKGKGAGGEGEKGGRRDTCALGARPGTQTKDGERCEQKTGSTVPF
jgi:hypothetical protein